MNPLQHQLRTDIRHLRPWLIAFWATLPVQALLATLAGLHWEVRTVLETGLVVVQGLLAVIVTVRVVQADAFVSDTAFWRTRPLKPVTLLAAKSLLVLLALLLPFTLASVLGWLTGGVSASKLPVGIASLWLVVLPGVAIVLALAGISRNLAQLVVGFIELYAVFFLTMLVVQWGGEIGWLPGRSFPVDASSTALALAWLMSWSLLAWSLSARRKPGISFVLLAVAVTGAVSLRIVWRFPLLERVSLPEVELAVIPMGGDEPLEPAADDQILWSTFRVENLPTNQLAAVARFDASFEPEDARKLRFEHRSQWSWPGLWLTLIDSPQEGDYFRQIQSAFPADTLWSGDWSIGSHRWLPLNSGGDPVRIRNDARGRFSGSFDLQLHEVRRLVDVPLEPATLRLDDKTTVILRRVRADAQGIAVVLEERRTAFLLESPGDAMPYGGEGITAFVYVLHRSITGEAVVRDPNRSGRRTPEIYRGQTIRQDELRFEFSRLQAHLTGVPMTEWLKGARLHIFEARPIGWAREQFDIADFNLRMDGNPLGQMQRGASLSALNELRLPEDASPAEAARYVERVEDLSAELQGARDWRLFREKFLALGANHLNALIAAWPIDERIRSSAGNPVLTQLAGRQHLPALLRALRRDPGLVWLFQQKKWEDDARPVLREMLSEYEIPLPPGAVAIAAKDAPPESYAALARRFTLLEYGHEQVVPELEKLPGFDLKGAVRAAWRRALVGVSDRAGLSIAAARLGLPHALDSAIEAIDRKQRSYEESFWSRQLRELTGYQAAVDETPEAFRDWLLENWGCFAYDADLRGYRVE